MTVSDSLPGRALRAVTMALALGVAATQPWAASIAGHDYAEQTVVAGKDLPLNGVGVATVRLMPWLKGYTAGLYVAPRTADGAAVLADTTTAKRLRISLLVDVSSEEFVKAFDGGVEKRASPELKARLAARMARFDAQIRALGTLKKNDAVDIDFVPGHGVQVSLNGQPRGEAIEGADLYNAMLDIFIGDRPVNPQLKAGLMGAKAP